jgi:hypothetical protein
MPSARQGRLESAQADFVPFQPRFQPPGLDFGIDTRRRRVAIPFVMVNRVEFWDLPRR